MNSIRDQLLARVRRLGRGRVVTPKDFGDLGSRDAVDQALHRLVKAGDLLRLGRGLYHYPRTNARLGILVPPNLDDVAAALGRQVGARVAPSGALAANQLGLSLQVPAIPVYVTDGRSRKVRCGMLTVQLKHVAPKRLPPGAGASVAVFAALEYLGREAIDDAVVRSLRGRLTGVQRRAVLRDARYASDWIADAARRVAMDGGERGKGHG